ncbi:MAG: PepSY-associated TM helix domain-containing protein [Deferrisomatales bacterium]|nr:PepSY-associated TM helix domain-containing protein [Deferrisomatales bacterium]
MSAPASKRPAPVAGTAWRRWNRAVHRDLGYLCLGLTLAYAVSGVALNHIHHWNPNYRIERSRVPFSPSVGGDLEAVTREALAAVQETRPLKSSFEPAPGQVHLFVEGNTLRVDIARGTIEQERAVERPLLFPLNSLHLNRLKHSWTGVADVYAVALAVLAVTGILIPRGRNGLTQRGAWLTVGGILLPIIFLLALS